MKGQRGRQAHWRCVRRQDNAAQPAGGRSGRCQPQTSPPRAHRPRHGDQSADGRQTHFLRRQISGKLKDLSSKTFMIND